MKFMQIIRICKPNRIEASAAAGPGPSLLVWDADFEAWPWDGPIALWKQFAKDGNAGAFSIPALVEEKAEQLRALYLAWIYEFGEELVDGKRVIDHLELRPGFSFWWMTLPTLVSFGGATCVYDTVRMLALEDLAKELACRSIVLVSDRRVLAEALRKWCSNAHLAFRWHRLEKKTNPVSLPRRIFETLPYPLQGLFTLFRHVKQRRPLRYNKAHLSGLSGEGVIFVDYLIHLDSESISQGRFGSNYWTLLVSVLQSAGIKTKWIHHYLSHPLIPSARKAKNRVDKFNQNEGGLQFHTTLDSALSLRVLFGVARDFTRLVVKGLRLRSVKGLFVPKGSDVDFEPLIRGKWRNFLFGNLAVSGCLFLNKFEFLLKRTPRQSLCFFLQENQAWEMAFIHAWKSAGHGQLIGVPHTTVLFWDTRYFFDARSYQRGGNGELPMPQKVALNGPASIAQYLSGGYPENQIVEVEALRYLFLEDFPSQCSEIKIEPHRKLQVLVLGDFFPDITSKLMDLLVQAERLLPRDISYTAKPHPACAIRGVDYSSLQLNVTNAPLAELFINCDVAFTSNITSAAVDAYCAGIPVISVLDPDALNMSPLRGLDGVVYVTNPAELADALKNLRPQNPISNPYFCLDKRLQRWRKLLGLNRDCSGLCPTP